ncbi:fatty acid alpha-hydroxylase [Kappamyces sp. JEL0680]|nr:fatty acid alpha-hydroxylase [Kappamyces sp. JEL0680]
MLQAAGAPRKVFTKEQVAAHHTTGSLWVTVKGRVYDLTHFMDSHPGGEEILLQYGGQDVTDVLQDVHEHQHSDSAYEMLEEYYVGDFEVSNEPKSAKKDKVTAFIDVQKPMLTQVWNGNFSKQFYLEQVHIPRHTKESPRLFAGPLELLSKTPWWVIPIFWTPIISYCISKCLETNSAASLVLLFPLGLFSWTLIEYSLHRFLFHLDDLLPDHRVFLTLHFLLHGIHHYLPMDRLRLVMPPALGFALAYPIWSLYVFLFPNGVGQGLISGAMTGFVMYDMMHYYVHHAKPYFNHMKEMKSYHLDHHYKNANMGFGITSKFWDRVFNTVLEKDKNV